MRVLISGGGTAGHVTPGIAIAEYIKERSPKSEILFVGRKDGDENNIIARAGFNLLTLDVHGFKRSMSPKNITTAMKMIIAFVKARRILKDFKPDIVIGTGGYVTWPAVKAAQCLKIPTMIHESNAYPGLTTRVLSASCDRVLLNYDECKNHLKRQDNTLVVGNPLRGELMRSTREEARRKLGIAPSEIFILSFGGSGGSEVMNRNILEVEKGYSAKNKRIRHLHATGRKYFDKAKEEFPELTKDSGRCRAVSFINDMPTYMLACDIVIARAGAMTLSEISKAGVAPIIIPSPNVTDDHQTKNAEAFERVNGGIVIAEKELTSERLTAEIDSLVTNRRRREMLAKCAHGLHVRSSAERIFYEIEKALKKSF